MRFLASLRVVSMYIYFGAAIVNGLAADLSPATRRHEIKDPPAKKQKNGFPTTETALNLHFVTHDTASVRFVKAEHQKIAVWMQSDICIGCKLLSVAHLKKDSDNPVALVDTQWALRISVTDLDADYPKRNNTFCELYYHFKQDGGYNLTVPATISFNGTDVTRCSTDLVRNPTFADTAILIVYGTVFLGVVCAAVWVYCIKKHFIATSLPVSNGNIYNFSTDQRPGDEAPLTTPINKPNKMSQRQKSVDTFRGLAIAQLVCGVAGDGKYPFLAHSVWYGMTVADTFFPWFVFIMGTSIHLAINILLSKGQSFRTIFKKVVIRSIILFILGVFIQSKNNLLTLRIPGVLQRFGITYFIVASCYLFSRWLLARRKTERTNTCFLMFRDIVDYIELPVAALCITIHVLITFLLPVPGCPRGYQGPGGPLVGINGELTNCTGGAAGYIDRAFFTPAHLIKTGKIVTVYHTKILHDPEGILGTFTSVALCIFGLQAGKILHHFHTASGRLLRLVLWGVLLITCSAVLSKCTMADGWIPINKNLWSVSYICLTSGTAFLVQALFHVLIDVTRFWNGAPLIYAGMNSLMLYVGSEIMSRYLPFTWQPIVGNHAEYCAIAYWSMTLWLIIAYVAYRKKFFLKI
ncbi:heparan-alpha-glucosaminide N-acetyltransferase-like [Diadema antillarum]|uniref:heparan-alpha-glucosaminide N-acetyltransferase-like n=1 Tax=Diadema antillarum TaxID=105358 RepID=UPI003A86E1A9